MRILLLGANGQLGSDIVGAAKVNSGGVEVVQLCRRDLDVSKIESISDILSRHSFDVLINCASYHKTDEVEQNASLAISVNAHAVQRLARVCKNRGARFAHISTDYVFGGGISRPYVETDCPRPVNVYGASKLLGENLALHEYAAGTLIFRVASLFGVAGASGKGGNFVETMLRVGKTQGKLRVVDDITMSPTSTADVAKIILRLLAEQVPAGIYHVVNSGQTTWFEFAREIVRRAGVAAEVSPVSSEEYPTVALRPSYSALDNGKVRAVVGEIPCWQQALESYLNARKHIP